MDAPEGNGLVVEAIDQSHRRHLDQGYVIAFDKPEIIDWRFQLLGERVIGLAFQKPLKELHQFIEAWIFIDAIKDGLLNEIMVDDFSSRLPEHGSYPRRVISPFAQSTSAGVISPSVCTKAV